MRKGYSKKTLLRTVRTVSALIIVSFCLSALTSAVLAVDWSAGAGAPEPFGMMPEGDAGIGGNEGNVGGRQGENYNSPAANGGGEAGGSPSYGDRGREDAMNGAGDVDDFDETFDEEGEVLGVTDSENSATVGIIIAIIIALAVIVLIIALLPKGTAGS